MIKRYIKFIIAHFALNCNSAFRSDLYFLKGFGARRFSLFVTFGPCRLYRRKRGEPMKFQRIQDLRTLICPRSRSVISFTSASVPTPTTKLAPGTFQSKCWSALQIIMKPALTIWLAVLIIKKCRNCKGTQQVQNEGDAISPSFCIP